MPEPSNADRARNLLEADFKYLDQERVAIAGAQVYALLAIADALNTKDTK